MSNEVLDDVGAGAVAIRPVRWIGIRMCPEVTHSRAVRRRALASGHRDLAQHRDGGYRGAVAGVHFDTCAGAVEAVLAAGHRAADGEAVLPTYSNVAPGNRGGVRCTAAVWGGLENPR